jgi:hypothetical protein
MPQPGEIDHQRAARQDRSALPQAASIYTPPGPMTFIALTPCRVMDTRGNGFTGAFGPPSLTAGGTPRQVPIPDSSCNVPSNAGAYSLNITVVPQGPIGFLVAYPTGQPLPLAATLVWSQGSITSNAAIVAGGTSGSVDLYASSATDVVIDINGYYAAPSDLAGNTAIGTGALGNNTIGFGKGIDNTAFGTLALSSNTTGSGNTASGDLALVNNTTGSNNTASGFNALQNNTTGFNNTASGFNALVSNNTGTNNIAIGVNAASAVSGGNSDNIHIGSQGAATDSGTIRIGTPLTTGGGGRVPGQTSFFAAGVRGAITANNNAIPVMIDSSGQLGTISSSRRFKEDIQDMGDASRGLMRLRPVTFRYQKPFADGSKPIQYGLIAEEVAEVYPDLVAHSADGQIEAVKYQLLDAMLLNEVQRQRRMIEQQQHEIEALKAQLNGVSVLESRLVALENAVAGNR